MRRGPIIAAVLLSLVCAACGSDPVVTGGDERPTARPAPTIAGEIIEVEPQEVQAETVLIGISADETVSIHALPGLDQPVAGEVPPGTSIEPMGAAFETDDGLTWWQVRAGDLQGWVQPNIAYRGPATDISDQVASSIGADTTYASADAAATAVADLIAAEQGAPEVVIVDRSEGQGPGATYTTDLLGFQDDSVIGSRLIITMSNSAQEWTPESVLQFALCSRGVSPEGLCL